MHKTAGKVTDAAGSARPYVERALKDEDLRDNVKTAFAAAREIYDELVGDRGVTRVAAKVAGDQDIHENLRTAVSELRSAADRLQGKDEHHKKGGSALLITGIALGLLFNPVTGPGTRRWLMSLVGGGSDHHGSYAGNGTAS
jgi:hypothetical protein